jgi:deoxyribonuclease IV
MLIGGHVSSAGGLRRALERAEAMGCETMQIFNQSPRMWRPTTYSEEDLEGFRAGLAQSSVRSIFIHAVYLINCASEDREIRQKSLRSLTHALSVGDAIGAEGVVVHPGSGKSAATDATIDRIGDSLRRVLADSERCPLLLENTAGAGGTVGRAFEEIAQVIDSAGRDERIGVCLDSCHLLASGHEVRTREGLATVVDDCDRELGLGRLRCLHLNDSKTALGSNRDRHANLGEGELGEEGIRVFLGEPRFEGLPVLLEVPGPEGKGPDRGQIEIAKRLRGEARGASRAASRSSRGGARAAGERPIKRGKDAGRRR